MMRGYRRENSLQLTARISSRRIFCAKVRVNTPIQQMFSVIAPPHGYFRHSERVDSPDRFACLRSLLPTGGRLRIVYRLYDRVTTRRWRTMSDLCLANNNANHLRALRAESPEL